MIWMIINDIGYYIYIIVPTIQSLSIDWFIDNMIQGRILQEISVVIIDCGVHFPLKTNSWTQRNQSLEDWPWPSIHCLKHSKITCFTRCTKDLKIRTSGVYFQIRHHLINLINLITLKNLASPKILRVKDWVPLQSDG